jgi:hypothetical protein
MAQMIDKITYEKEEVFISYNGLKTQIRKKNDFNKKN